MASEKLKKLVGEAVVDVVEYGDVLGCGTGSTVAYFLNVLEDLDVVECVPTSDETKAAIMAAGKKIVEVNEIDKIDVGVDGADWVDLDSGVCIKGGGGAHFLEKKVAQKCEKFVVIVDRSKVVENFDGLWIPLDVELDNVGVVIERLKSDGYSVFDRKKFSDTGGALIDVTFDSEVQGFNLDEFDDYLHELPGMRATGIFMDEMDECWVACSEDDLRVYEF